MVDSPQIFKGVCSKVFLIDGIKKNWSYVKMK